MNLSEIFVRRPVMTLLVMLGILTFGIVAYRQLPVAQLPNVDFPTIQVRAELPGASPETMATQIVAEQFQVDPSQVNIVYADTQSGFNSTGPGGSRFTVMIAGALGVAALMAFATR